MTGGSSRTGARNSNGARLPQVGSLTGGPPPAQTPACARLRHNCRHLLRRDPCESLKWSCSRATLGSEVRKGQRVERETPGSLLQNGNQGAPGNRPARTRRSFDNRGTILKATASAQGTATSPARTPSSQPGAEPVEVAARSPANVQVRRGQPLEPSSCATQRFRGQRSDQGLAGLSPVLVRGGGRLGRGAVGGGVCARLCRAGGEGRRVGCVHRRVGASRRGARKGTKTRRRLRSQQRIGRLVGFSARREAIEPVQRAFHGASQVDGWWQVSRAASTLRRRCVSQSHGGGDKTTQFGF